MKKIYFTPGPTQLYPTVKKHILDALKKDITSISHRSAQFEKIVENTQIDLRKLLNIPTDYQIFFLSSGTEAMERTIENTVLKQSFHFVNGAFSERWQKTSRGLGKEALDLKIDRGDSFDFDNTQIPGETELICFTHNETSTGVMLNPEQIYALKKKHPDKLVAVDIVSSAPYVNLDYSKIDMAFFSAQKGFGLPAGLGILVVSPKAMEKSADLPDKNPRTYHSFTTLEKYMEKHQTPETPNVLGVYLLSKVCKDMLKRRIKKIRKETDAKFEELDNFLEESEVFSHFVKDQNYRSRTVIVSEVKSGSEKLLQHLEKQGVIVGSGYKENKNKQIRIANFPATDIIEWQKMITVLHEFK